MSSSVSSRVSCLDFGLTPSLTIDSFLAGFEFGMVSKSICGLAEGESAFRSVT